MAFQTGPVLDVPLNLNQDDVVNPQDAQTLYYLALPQSPANLMTLLSSLNVANPGQDVATRLAALNLLGNVSNAAGTVIVAMPMLDLNRDGVIDLPDVRVLYYALRFEDILRASPSLRETLLGDLTTEDNGLSAAGRQQVYIELLDRVDDLFPVVTTSDNAIEVDTGASYALTTTDLNARDPDNAGLALSWTVTTAPMNGRLALSDATATAIDTFTQAQLEAGEVFYVHTGSNNDRSDNFAVRLQNPDDPEGTVRPIIPLTVALSTPTDTAPMSVTLTPVATLGTPPALAEDADVTARTRVADIAVMDNDGGERGLQLVGPDAALFELNDDQDVLFLRAGATLDFETNPDLAVTVQATRNPAGATADLSLAISDANDAPTTTGDGGFTVVEGASYVLTVADLAATDVDAGDDAAALTWTLVADPEPPLPPLSGGRLELSGAAGTAIDSFTQAQLEAGEVVYVHGGGNAVSDGFTLQVADDEGLRAAEPVVVSVEVTRRLDFIDLSALSVAEGFVVQGDGGGDNAGFSVSGAGDVNGDGYADFIVGALQGDDGGTNAGEAYVVFGRATDSGDTTPRVVDLTELAPADGFIIQGDAPYDNAGYSVSGAGDVNGDGYADLIVGARYGDDGGTNAGEAYVVFGKAGGLSDLFGSADGAGRRFIDLASLAAGDGFIIQGDAANDRVSGSVSGAGDVNGDGFTDLIVGARYGDDGGGNAGQAYVVFGKQDGFGSADSDGRRFIDLESLAAGDGFIIQGDMPGDQAGVSVSGAGDVNGDGYADLIVGAHYGDDGGTYAGEAYVVFGKPDDFGEDVSNTLDEDGTTMVVRRVVDLDTLAPEGGFIIQGDAVNDYAGRSVSRAGDVNGDGYADLIVGANLADVGTRGNAGEAYVVFGKPDDPSDPFGSLDGAGRRFVDLTELAPEDGFIIQGDANLDRAGGSVSGAGDVNGDGFADLLVGAPLGDDGGNNAGEAYLIFGKADGFGNAMGIVDLDGLAQEDGFIIRGDAPGDGAGTSVSAAGDVNGDGYADLIVGANGADVTKSEGDTRDNAGEAYVLFGGPAGLSTEAAAVLGTDANDLALNADGAATVVLAGAGDDVLNIDGFGPDDLLRFDGGTGTDTLRLSGGDLSLDLSTLAGTRLSSIEHIDLSGSGPGMNNNSLTLTRQDLLNLSEVRTRGTDGTEASRAELRVDGNAGDRVNVIGDWMRADATQDIGTTTYNVFDNGNARLLVNTAVSVDITRLLGSIDLSELSAAEGFVIQGDAAGDQAGYSVSGAGDVNGDGFADLIVGARYGDDGGDNAGEAYVLFGGPDSTPPQVIDLTNLAAADGFIIQGDAPGDFAGRSVSAAGDVNGDGFADLIVGANGGDDSGGVNPGEAYVVFGKASTPRVVDLTSLAAGDGFILRGDQGGAPGATNGDNAGISVSGAGDVNGDGFADLIVGAYLGDDGGTNAGEAYVVFGKASNPRVINLSGLAPADGFIIQGDAPYDNAGRSVSGAGDVNGDGYADLIVGAHIGSDGGYSTGEAYVVFGKQGDFGNLMGGRRVVDLSSLAAGDGFIIQGDAPYDNAGFSVSGAGDINGDGYADLIIGARGGDDGGDNAGEAYVVFGKQDGFGRVIDLSSLTAGDGFIIRGDAPGDNAGFSVSAAGDVNGDGFADLIVGARDGDDGGDNAGAAYLIFGKAPDPSDPSSNPFGSDMGGRRVIDLTGLAPEDGFIIQGDTDGDRAGRSVSGAGDVNGDGFADLIVGASEGNDGGDNAGEAYVLFGSLAGLSTEAAAVVGTIANDLALNADGEATVVLAGAGDDVLNIDGFGPDDLLRFDGGSGTDVLRLNGGDLNLDLSTLAGSRLSSIERIDLSGGAGMNNNSLRLTRLDLLNLSEVRTRGADGTEASRAELRVDGNAGDRVTLDGDWMQGTDVTMGATYNVFDNGNARLLVNAAVTVEVVMGEVPTTSGDGALRAFEGGSQTLTPADFSAGDPDNDADTLTWTVTRVPMNGRLALSSDLATAITSFTQQQLENGEVVYVHTGSAGSNDSFVVRVADDLGNQAEPVTVSVEIRGELGDIDLSGLSVADGFIIQGDAAGDRAGASVSGAGDVNGDGFADLIVGAPFGDDGGTNAGEAYVVFGKASTPRVVDLTNLAPGDGFIIQGGAPGDRAGVSVSGAGDVNGDGYADLIVGANFGADGGLGAGEAYVVFGKASGPGVVDLTNLAAGDGFIIQGDEANDRAGVSVSGAGDVNGDGYADLIVGARYGDDGGNNAGEAYVVFGKEDNFGSDVRITLEDDTTVVRRVIDLTNLGAGDGFIIQGDAGGDQAGRSVSGAGDVNGDGFADLIVGASQADVPTSGDDKVDAGEAYVVFGKASGFGIADSTGRRVVELESLVPDDGFIIQGDAAGDQTGRSVSGAGDVNGDGFADLIFGAIYGDDDSDNVGEAYVVFGKATDPSDPFGEVVSGRQVIDLESLAAGDGFIIQGDAADDLAGISVSGAGDVNGDGFADLLVGASTGDDGGTNAGEAYLVFGKEDGFGELDDDTGRRVIDLTGLAAGNGFIIEGDAPGDRAGGSVSAAGDVNGDGFADLLVGATNTDVTKSVAGRPVTFSYAGEAYVLFGGPAAGLTTETLAGDDVLSDDDDDGVVLAGPGDDVLNIDGFTDTDPLRFDGGSGTDTLRLVNPDATTDLSLDLSTLRDTRLISIERIDLSGQADNSLTLNRLDLLNLSEVRIDGRAELRVDGNAGDRVATADSGWTARGREEIDEVFYNVYDNGNARLLVNTAIDISGIRLGVDLGALTPAEGFTIRGDAADDQAGFSVSDAGDVNGDGYADVIVGAPRGDDGGITAGEAYVIFGQASGETSGPREIDLTNLDAGDGFIIQGDNLGDFAGTSVSSAGDVNGDGYADLLVGARFGAASVGEAYVVFGKAADPSDPFGSPDSDNRQVVDSTNLAAADGFIIQGDASNDNVGFSVSSAGDVNGDGYTDLIIGAPYGDPDGDRTNAGEAYLIFGKASGFGSDMGGRQVIDLGDLAAGDGFIIRGDMAGDRAGNSVSSAGDVNGDGYADLIIGALLGDDGGDDGGDDAGEAYVVFGKPDNFGVAEGGGRVIDLSSLEAADGFVIQGDTTGDFAGGRHISSAGDVNGDGYADVIIGARGGDDGGTDAGEAYVVFGKASDFGSPPDSTGRRVVDLTNLSAADGFIIQGETAYDGAGQGISGAGDLNGDGFDDLLVGAPRGDDGEPADEDDYGEAYVVFGKSTGTSNTFGELVGSRRVVDLTDLSAADGYTIRGDAADDRAGYSVSVAGDVNGDGYADLIIGANLADVTNPDGTPRTDAGEAYVVFGGPVGLATEAAAELGTAGDDVLNAAGEATVVLAGAGDDVLNIDGFGDTDLLRFDGGSGTDTLRLVNPDADTGLSLNLSALADARLSSIERIDLSGGADNIMSLTRLALLSLSEERADGRAELRVDGNTGDTVTAPDDGWAQGGDVMIAGTMYRAFDNGNARLLVNMDVSLAGNLMATSLATSAALLQNCCTTQTVDVRALIADLPPEDEAQQRQRLEDELAMLGPLPAARAAIDLADPVTVAEPDADLFDLPTLVSDDG